MEKSRIIISTGLVYKLELLRVIVSGFAFMLLINYFKLYLSVVIICSILSFSFLRIIRFYDTYFEVIFLFRFKERISYNEVAKVEYLYGGYGQLPTFAIYLKDKNFLQKVHGFFSYRFVSSNSAKVGELEEHIRKVKKSMDLIEEMDKS